MAYTVNGILFSHKVKLMRIWFFLLSESCQYLTLYSINMTYNLKKSIIKWESVCISIRLHPWGGSLSAQCVVLML